MLFEAWPLQPTRWLDRMHTPWSERVVGFGLPTLSRGFYSSTHLGEGAGNMSARVSLEVRVRSATAEGSLLKSPFSCNRRLSACMELGM